MLTPQEKSYLLELAQKSLIAHFEGKTFEPKPPSPSLYPHLWEKRALFVTLYKERSLRGCVGNIAPEEALYKEVCKVVLASAFEDPRFPPLNKEELPLIDIEISLLSPFKKVGPEEIVIGRDGIYVKKGFRRGLLLPQVATENNWDRETFLAHACLKAGLPKDCYLDPEVEIYVFTVEVIRESEKSSLIL
ncbi:MAG: AmmeMemoRadiSam system protein A [Caldimicrobium sp.]|nr:AmmeMemoRadiSam system protein A [Caldimicrobium sp.]MCX7873170.1 AmmeMemoRadiSam system protein A [Caldimicrobium sp.]MDW8094251.1 AmmeMemoRadiSam system protein A [Caldimicrobium sp.]